MRAGGSREPLSSPAPWVALLMAALLLVSLVPVACGGDGSPASSTTSAATAPTAPVGTSTEAPPQGGRAVTFETEDGVTLSGHLFGSGDRAVVLSHMYPADQSSWYNAARRLADEGYLALTYDFRGYGDSSGTKQIEVLDRDVDAAVCFLRSQGLLEIALVGASMGGTASLIPAETYQAMSSWRVAGVATLSAPVGFQGLSAADAVPDLLIPLVFIAAEGDSAATRAARELQDLSGGKGDLQIVSGSEHGTDMLTGPEGDKVYRLLTDFLGQSFLP